MTISHNEHLFVKTYALRLEEVTRDSFSGRVRVGLEGLNLELPSNPGILDHDALGEHVRFEDDGVRIVIRAEAASKMPAGLPSRSASRSPVTTDHEGHAVITLADLDDQIAQLKVRDQELRATIARAEREQKGLRPELYALTALKKRLVAQHGGSANDDPA